MAITLDFFGTSEKSKTFNNFLNFTLDANPLKPKIYKQTVTSLFFKSPKRKMLQRGIELFSKRAGGE